MFKQISKGSIAKLEEDEEAAESKQSIMLADSLKEDNTKSLRQADNGYQSDERSGDEVTDSDKEFDEIVELDNIIKSILESTLEVNELHSKIVSLFAKLR
jgi:tRNA splicing ligase